MTGGIAGLATAGFYERYRSLLAFGARSCMVSRDTAAWPAGIGGVYRYLFSEHIASPALSSGCSHSEPFSIDAGCQPQNVEKQGTEATGVPAAAYQPGAEPGGWKDWYLRTGWVTHALS